MQKLPQKELVRIRHVKVGLLPHVKIYKSESGCKFGDKCLFRHTEADGLPIKRSKKSDGKGSVASLKESIQLGCVSQDTEHRRSLFFGKVDNSDQIAPSHSPRAHGTT